MYVGIVGGSDLKKIKEQLGDNGNSPSPSLNISAVDDYDFVFAENGVINYKNGIPDPKPNVKQMLSFVTPIEFGNLLRNRSL